MELIYTDRNIVVCVKPAGVPSTDVPGGLPELVRQALGDPQATVKTVHRLDQVVSGVMVLARTARTARELSRQIQDHIFEKNYLAVVHGCPEAPAGTLRDLLLRDKAQRKTLVVSEPGPQVQEALLDYQVLAAKNGLSRIEIRLRTGRTHQIRTQFSSRGMPLVGDRKYGCEEGNFPIALWSHRIAFRHTKTGEWMEFTKEPPAIYPWTAV